MNGLSADMVINSKGGAKNESAQWNLGRWSLILGASASRFFDKLSSLQCIKAMNYAWHKIMLRRSK